MERNGRYTLDGAEINRLRRRLGWSVRRLADVAGTSHDAIIDLEHNRRRPRGELMRKLAAALGVEPQALLRKPQDDR